MTDFEAIKKISESKAFNGRFGKACDTIGLALGPHVRQMGRWNICQVLVSGKDKPTFNWSKSYSPK